MQIKSNALVKFVVPAVVLVGLAVTMKSCKTQENVADRGEQARALSGLSSEELRALGWKVTRRKTHYGRWSPV
ncbi:Uncharacterised protein [Escherichia coli]|uniref:Uncharacterized protein n=1 Tax=Escherichia coli TaxID=562 RepID=A0A376W857_ECOLX|nr:Uncharacterised protein [Escherichia coli]